MVLKKIIFTDQTEQIDIYISIDTLTAQVFLSATGAAVSAVPAVGSAGGTYPDTRHVVCVWRWTVTVQ